jgi:hypothetical protein
MRGHATSQTAVTSRRRSSEARSIDVHDEGFAHVSAALGG